MGCHKDGMQWKSRQQVNEKGGKIGLVNTYTTKLWFR
jgi:hypothetical protein